MSFVYDALGKGSFRSVRRKNVNYTDLFQLEFEKGDPNGTYVKRRDAILEFVEETQAKIRRLNFIGKKKNRSERILAMEEAELLFCECKEKMEKKADDHVYHLLLRELDKGEETHKGVTRFHALLFAVMCYANDGYLLKKLKVSDVEMFDLLLLDERELPKTDPSRLVFVYGHPHVKGRWRNRI